jgi:MGT family glycosyltransferase
MSTGSQRFLFTMWEGGGTLPPELGLARRLVERGHEVHVLGDPTIAERARAGGCGFSPWRRAPHRTSLDPSDDLIKDWELSNPLQMVRSMIDNFMAGPAAAFASDTVDVIGEVEPDLVVADSMMLGTMVAAEAAKVPFAVLVPNIWMMPTPGVPPIGPGFAPARSVLGHARDAALRAATNRIFRRGLLPLNTARAEHGLAPLPSLFEQILGADRVLVLTSAAFDFAAPKVPANVHYVGPVLDDPDWAEPWSPPWPHGNDDPVVLVAFSSTFQDQGAQLRRVVEALSGLEVRAVVTLGQAIDTAEVTPEPNVVVVPSAPHAPILREASLVVTHCGHGTTLKALAAGIPLVCMPMGRDQNDTAARVVHHGAGRRLSPKASTAKIAAAVEHVLGDDRYRREAGRLAAAIADEQQRTNAASELEALAATRDTGRSGA